MKKDTFSGKIQALTDNLFVYAMIMVFSGIISAASWFVFRKILGSFDWADIASVALFFGSFIVSSMFFAHRAGKYRSCLPDLEDFVEGSYAKLVQCYSYGKSHWAIFCPIDEVPSDSSVVHVRVNKNFDRRFVGQKNLPIRFVQSRGDIQDKDREEGIWPVVLDEVLGETKPIRCKGEKSVFEDPGEPEPVLGIAVDDGRDFTGISRTGKLPAALPHLPVPSSDRAAEIVGGCRASDDSVSYT